MTLRDNAWFIENAGKQNAWLDEARDLRQQADVLREQARRLERDASALSAQMEMFQDQAITATQDAWHDGRMSMRYGSLPRHRFAHVYECANRPGMWAGNLEALDVDHRKVYDGRVYTGGLFLGFHDSPEALTETAKQWVAFGTLPGAKTF